VIITIYKDDFEWLAGFAKFHRINNEKDTIHKLIEIHKVWNIKQTDEVDKE